MCLFSQGREGANQPHTQHQHHKSFRDDMQRLDHRCMWSWATVSVSDRWSCECLTDTRWSGTERGKNRNLILYTHNSVYIPYLFIFIFSSFQPFVCLFEFWRKPKNKESRNMRTKQRRMADVRGSIVDYGTDDVDTRRRRPSSFPHHHSWSKSQHDRVAVSVSIYFHFV